VAITVYANPGNQNHVFKSRERLSEVAESMYGDAEAVAIKLRASVPEDTYWIVYDGLGEQEAASWQTATTNEP
jgi:hypothetical protein